MEYSRRAWRVRYKLKSRNVGERLRLSVHKSEKNIYAQIIDGDKTLVSFSTLHKEYKEKAGESKSYNLSGAAAVGAIIADKALKSGISSVYFDRGGYKYMGRIKALVEAVREGGVIV